MGEPIPVWEPLAYKSTANGANSRHPDPIFAICQRLSERGHEIQFATLPGRENLADGWPMVTKVHLVGREITPAEDDAFYQHLWDIRGGQAGSHAKAFVDSYWAGTFSGLCALAADAITRPDFIIGDFQCEAAKDAAIEHGIPYGVVFPQFPWLIPTPHVPGLCGLHERAVCTEGARWVDRLWEVTFPYRRAPDLVKIWRSNKAIRWAAGLRRMPQDGVPDYIALVNSFEGFEIARDLPPNCAAVGPLLADTYPALDSGTEAFLGARKRVAYVAFGTHVMIDQATLDKLVSALTELMAEGLLQGVILSLSRKTRGRLQMAPGSRLHDLAEQHKDADWRVLDFAPQRAILAHGSTAVFITHGGASSTQEGLFHGTPMVCVAVYGDQLSNALRIERAGVGARVAITDLSAGGLAKAARGVLRDEDGGVARNVLRLQRIARVAARRKERGADLIEEHLYDWELRQDGAMHLQPASRRLSWIKLHNVDIWVPLLLVAATPALVLPRAVLVAVLVLALSVGVLAARFNTLTDLARIFSSSRE